MKGIFLISIIAAFVQHRHFASAGQVSTPAAVSLARALALARCVPNRPRIAQAELDALMDRMEAQARALADRVEWAHEHRCDTAYVGEAGCGDTNYHS
jgi:hypothetical protein